MTLRVIDSGLRGARENLSATEALRQGREAGTTPDTLRFQHFPPSAIIGRHQLLQREVDLDWCATRGVGTARRMTGGGAIVLGPGMLGWELVLARGAVPGSLDAVTARLCEAVASGLRALGAAAAYRPRNDIEVAGRKLSGTGGYVDGDVLVFQGTVLIEADLDLMMGALRLPVRKLGRRGLAALAERVGDLRTALGTTPAAGTVKEALADALGAALGSRPVPGILTAPEEEAARAIHDAEIGTDAFVHGLDDALPSDGRIVSHVTATPGGEMEVVLRLRDGAEPVVESALITGDFFAEPPSLMADLEARLRGCHAGNAASVARAHLAAAGGRFLGMRRDDVVAAVAAAAERAA